MHGLRLTEFVEPFVKRMADGSKDIVVAEGAIYLRSGRDPARVAAMSPRCRSGRKSALFSPDPAFARVAKGELRRGKLPTRPTTARKFGARHTLVRHRALESRARGRILVSASWTHDTNAHALLATTEGGVAGHGSSSPYDIHNTLIAAGPDFRERAISDVPTANVDLARRCCVCSG